MGQAYSAQDIEVLEGLEPVRKRPGMYIAGTDTPAGLHQLVAEILDNSVDEAMNGHADAITVILHADSCSVTVGDNGRGIPVDKHPKTGKSALEVILTTLHAGGKFSSKNYETSGGLHGVGSSVVNALSETLVATVCRDGRKYTQEYSRGVPLGPVRSSGKGVEGRGTTIFFRPDLEIFASIQFSPKIIRDAIQTKAYLNPGLKITFVDETTSDPAKKVQVFEYQDGILAYIQQIMAERKETAIAGEIFSFEKSDDIKLSVALAWTEGTHESFVSFANGIHTPDGGSHEMAAKSGIVKAWRNWIAVHDVQTKGLKISAEDIREGLYCVVSVKLPSGRYHVQFQGQTKGRLNNPEIIPLVENALRGFEQMLNEKPSVANAIYSRIVMAAKARLASRQAGESVRRKIGISHRITLPGKLADCSSEKAEITELFIVEGDSAGGSAKQGRDRNFQAILPLRGKILNTIAATGVRNVLDNKELSNIIAALGCGSGKDIKLSKMRYGKIIILTDADADGMHIGTLLIAFFFKYLRPVVEAGHLYFGRPPLYGVFAKGSGGSDGSKKKADAKSSKVVKGKSTRNSNATQKGVYWAYSEEQLNEIIRTKKLSSPRIVRYKGLGEMNPDTLWDTTLDPANRTLLKVCFDEAKEVEEFLDALMGSDSTLRSQLIEENAAMLDLDI